MDKEPTTGTRGLREFLLSPLGLWITALVVNVLLQLIIYAAMRGNPEARTRWMAFLDVVLVITVLAGPFLSRSTWTIAQRELRSYFTSPVAYVVIVFFLFFSGLIFTFTIFSPQAQAEMRGLTGGMVFLTLMVTPFITMSLLAQERASGTLEILLSKPLHDREVVLGKYLGALMVYLVMLVLTLTFPIILDKYGDLDWGPTLIAYLGLLMCGATFLAVGMFASSLTRSQMASAGICLGAFLFVWLIGWVSYLIGNGESIFALITKNISVFEIVGDFEKGLLDSKNLVYFLSVAGYFLFLTTRVIEIKRQV